MTIAAHTNETVLYPGYVNVTRHPEGIHVTVRGEPYASGKPGPTARVKLSEEVWAKLVRQFCLDQEAQVR